MVFSGANLKQGGPLVVIHGVIIINESPYKWVTGVIALLIGVMTYDFIDKW